MTNKYDITKIHTTPEVCDDGWHCEPSCQYLAVDEDYICRLSNTELGWYDYFIANCAEIKE